MLKPLTLSVLTLLVSFPALAGEGVMLSGEVAARNSEVFVAPRGDNWLMQIEWMIEEGQRVKPGDPVVQYNTASITSQVEQLEAQLRKVKAESKQKDLTQDLALKQAQHNLRIAKLNLQRAKLDAEIPARLLSQLNYERYQLEFTRAKNAVVEAEKQFKVKEKDVVAEKQRSQVSIAGAENELRRIQLMLELMTQRASREGTALYVDHPWTRDKIRAGDSVQRGFTVLEIPATDDLHIKAWLNEIDVANVEEGAEVKVSVDSRPQLEFSGVIKRIGRQAEPKQYWGKANYLDVEVEINDEGRQALLPGMSVLVAVGGE
jgi:multidrug resistance efflux pump